MSTKFGTVSFSAHKKDYGSVFYEYEKWLTGMLNSTKTDIIAIEGVNAGLKGSARYIITGLDCITHKIAYDRGVKRVSVSPSQVKKWLTGKGNADKAMMVEEVKKRGYNPTDDNQADAIAIMLLAKEIQNATI